MTIGLIPNTSKTDILKIVFDITEELNKAGIDALICESLLIFNNEFNDALKKEKYLPLAGLIEKSDMVISIGGDGTMLNTAYEVRNSLTPILGVNFGKLGFLAEFDLNSLKDFLSDIKKNNFIIEERMALIGSANGRSEKNLYAINDIVIEKGPWHKMIELTIKVDDDYVATFSADGIIIATPTGSTGYSLSTGGPIVNPVADVITLSPIAPHSLTMRPLVLSSKQKITIMVKSPHGKIQVSCDGQRAYSYDSPAEVTIEKSEKPVRLVHSNKMDYFQTLRNKLFWGLDVRKTKKENGLQ
jgi:NAD+ kinase